MKTTRLSLRIGGSWIAASLARTEGWLRRSTQAMHLPRLQIGAGERGLSEALASLAVPAGASLAVELGMAHARVGLMHLREGEGARLDRKALETYVGGWMQQMLHLQPSGQVVRWQVLRDPHYVLVSLIDQSVYATLLEFAGERRLKFVSCIPALLRPVREARRGAVDTLVWTEGAGALRDSSVQLLRFQRGQLLASWRGWLPPGPSGDGKDSELEAALQRFQVYSGGTEAAEVTRTHWPAMPEAA